ncbi:MAG: iron-containing redox enzyme family protein [Chloroflexi bacterium]|nr:iron-containing redox enzyme family protein [Chloroflexota bacterium]
MAIAVEPKTMSPAERVEHLERLTAAEWESAVTQHPFTRSLVAGDLPKELVKEYFRQLYPTVQEINASLTYLYLRFIDFWKANPHLEEEFTEKLGEELAYPSGGGHIRLLWPLAEGLGLPIDEMLYCKLLPGARAYTDWPYRIVREGTLPECFAWQLMEKHIGVDFGAIMGKQLQEVYGLSLEQVRFYTLHQEADLEHGPGNANMLRLALEAGYSEERASYGLEYCALMTVHAFRLLLDAIWEKR